VRRWPVVVGALVLAACSSGSNAATHTTVTTGTSNATAKTPTTTPGSKDLANVRVALTPVVSGFDSPVDVAWRAHDTRMFVAEQTGRIRVVSADGKLSPTPLLRVGPLSNGNEEGLLGITFSPDGSKLYVDYTDRAMDTHVDEYTMQGDAVVPASRRQVLFVKQPFANHNGGEVTFGPDGMLYIGLGDGGGAGDPNHNGQNLDTLLAKILRIDPAPKGGAAYSVPAGNPYVGKAGARPETWMWGLRNPWRFSFDRKTADMWIGDVGQDNYEEIDFARAGDKGINWGWSAREGTHGYHGGDRPPGSRDPILDTAHSDGFCAIVGGYVYRGKAIPDLDGDYLFGDNCDIHILAAVQSDGLLVDKWQLGPTAPQLTTFGQDPDGEVYAVTRSGTVYKFTAA
jgi:glucose/arabinose dehydrogenase